MAGIFSHQMTDQTPLIWCSVLPAILGLLCKERGMTNLDRNLVPEYQIKSVNQFNAHTSLTGVLSNILLISCSPTI